MPRRRRRARRRRESQRRPEWKFLVRGWHRRDQLRFSPGAEAFSRIVEFTEPSALSAPAPREATARVCVSCRNALGESPVWSERDEALYWVSAVEGELWSWNLQDAPYKIVPRFGTTLGFVALRGGAPGSLLLGGEDAILALDRGDRAARVLAVPPAEGNTRPNDGRVDREGRMVMGMCFRCADIRQTGRGDAAAATWIFRGEESRQL